MSAFEGSSYRRRLQELYDELDQTHLSYELGIELRKDFFKKMCGSFLKISRLKREMPVDEVLEFLKIPKDSFSEVESGLRSIDDREFFMLSTYLGCRDEAFVFLAKLQSAMTPMAHRMKEKLDFKTIK